MPTNESSILATPNYGYEKRQRELAKKQKKEEKLRAKSQRKDGQLGSDAPADAAADAPMGLEPVPTVPAAP